MRRKIEFLSKEGNPLERDDALRRIWLRSGVNPACVISAIQSRALMVPGASATWKLEVLVPESADENGVPSVFKYMGTLQTEKLGSAFSYAGMMDRMARNYNPSLYDPLKRVLDHYEDERRNRARGQVSAARVNDEQGSSLSSEAWARRGPV